jgi:hypothetical protein
MSDHQEDTMSDHQEEMHWRARYARECRRDAVRTAAFWRSLREKDGNKKMREYANDRYRVYRRLMMRWFGVERHTLGK